MKNKILKSTLLVGLIALVLVNFLVVFKKGNASPLKQSFLAQVNSDWASASAEEDNGCCPWYIPSVFCNEKTKSSDVTCSTINYAEVSYFRHNGGPQIGFGILKNVDVNLVWGYKSQYYRVSNVDQSPFKSQVVTCPTNGNCINCDEYSPCAEIAYY